MRAQTLKVILSGSVFFLLLIPAIAPVLSPKFRSVLSAIISDPTTQTVQIEGLRRATPLWYGGISLHNTSLYKLGVSPNPNQMVMGKDGYMFLGNDHVHAYDQITHRYNLPQTHIDDWIKVLEYERDYLSARGIPMLFVVAPSTGTIYADKILNLPEGLKKIPTLFDRVLKQVKKKNLPLLDVRAELIEARKTVETYSKLNSHWNDYGAWVAWQKIAPKIEALVPGAKMAGLKDTPDIQTVDAANEASRLVYIETTNAWSQPVRSKKFPDFYVQTEDGQSMPMSGESKIGFLDLPRHTISPNATSDVRALVFTDSMGTSLSPYWTASFKELLQVNHHVRMLGAAKFDFKATVEAFKPKLVLYIMTERYLGVPLGDIEAINSNMQFDLPYQNGDQIWPQKPNYTSPIVSADPKLNKASSIKLFEKDGKRLLKVSIEAEGAGALYIGFQISGVSIEGWHEFVEGKNDIVTVLPKKIDGNFIWIVRDTNRAIAKLTSIHVRMVK
jgi:hypothetical protein